MKIICLVGKSGSGKDTVYDKVMQTYGDNILKRVVSCTTRPMRVGEVEGIQYHFVSQDDFSADMKFDNVLEHREYNSFGNILVYYTRISEFADDGIYLVVCSLAQVSNYIKAFGKSVVYVVHLFVRDDIRLKRAIDREMRSKGDLKEVCRRFISDAEEWEGTTVLETCTSCSIENKELSWTVAEVEEFIEGVISSV